jgi:hypothetical protein
VRLFEDIFREMEASIRNLDFIKVSEAFCRNFEQNLVFFKVMCGFFKEFEVFFKLFPDRWRFFFFNVGHFEGF